MVRTSGDMLLAVRGAYHALEEASCAGQQHFSNTNTGCSISIFLGEVALDDPDTFTKPRDEFQIVSGS
jgi:hypothetical protein